MNNTYEIWMELHGDYLTDIPLIEWESALYSRYGGPDFIIKEFTDDRIVVKITRYSYDDLDNIIFNGGEVYQTEEGIGGRLTKTMVSGEDEINVDRVILDASLRKALKAQFIRQAMDDHEGQFSSGMLRAFLNARVYIKDSTN